jgi:hypothetical protein
MSNSQNRHFLPSVVFTSFLKKPAQRAVMFVWVCMFVSACMCMYNSMRLFVKR